MNNKIIRKISVILALGIIIGMLSSCTSLVQSTDEEENVENNYNSGYKNNYDSAYDKDDDFQDDVHDWMKDYADGKDYEYDDGGSYYCMGKGDSCNNKTRNAYDLYCGSCDPDGDNVEG